MITLIGAIIGAVMAAGLAGLAVGYIYERRQRREAQSVNESLEESIQVANDTILSLREELSRLNGIAQGRECDAMQRKFLDSFNNGQATMQFPRRAREA